MESILNSIKKMLGMDEEYIVYDTDIIIHINSVLDDLKRLGVGPSEGYKITGPYETWSEFIGDVKGFESVKTYVYLRVRLLFDPPTSSAVMEAMKAQADKYEWLLNVSAETPT